MNRLMDRILRRPLSAGFCLLTVLGTAPFAAAQTPVGPPIDVHSTAASGQENPRIDSSATGTFVVAWRKDGSEILSRRFNDVGTPIDPAADVAASPGASIQELDVAMAGTGAFAVVWEQGYDTVFGRRFEPSGDAAGGAFQVAVQTGEFGVGQVNPRAAMDAAGAFAVTWRTNSSDNGKTWVKSFDASGSGGAPVEVNNDGTLFDYSEFPDIAMAPSGEFVVAWDEYSYAYPGRIGSRPFSASGSPTAAETQLDPSTFNSQTDPQTAHLVGGGYVVVWTEELDPWGPPSAGWAVAKAHRLSASGAAIGGVLPVADFYATSVAALADGGFVVVGDLSSATARRDGIAARLFTADGTPRGDAFEIVAPGNDLHGGQVATLADGFVVTWADPSVAGIRAQRYAVDGAGTVPGGFAFLPGRGLADAPPTLPLFDGAADNPLLDCEFVDLDGDGELEAVVEHSGAPAGTVITRDLGDGDADVDLIFVGTQGLGLENRGSFAAAVDLDGDGELEIIVTAPELATGATLVRDVGDGDADSDVIFVGTGPNGDVLGIGDLDGDGDNELVVAAPDLASTSTISRDLGDGDADLDVLFVGTTAGADALFADIDGDGEVEVLIENENLAPRTAQSRDLGDNDADDDVIFVSSQGGGGLADAADLDGDGELEVLIADTAGNAGTTTSRDLGEGDADPDLVFGSSSGGYAGQVDLDGDGEPEAIYNDDTAPAGSVVVRDLGDGDADPDVVFVGTAGGGVAVAEADLDGDGESELIVEAPGLASAGFLVRDLGDGDADPDIVFVAALGGGQVVRSLDLDGDGEVEVVILDGDAAVGSVVTRDLGDGDADDDLIFVGTDGGLPAFVLDIDGDGENELAVDAPALTAGTVLTRDLGDGDADAEIVFLGIAGGGGATGVIDLDGDGELEIVVEAASFSSTQVVTRDLGDGDADADVIFVADPADGAPSFGADLDGDGELEILVEDPSTAAGQVVTRDLGDGDADDDVIFIGTAGGGRLLFVADNDGDGEPEAVAESTAASVGTVITRDLGDGDADDDVIFVGIGAAEGRLVGLVNSDGDNDTEIVVENRTAARTVITRDLGDGDGDDDVLFVGVQGGGRVFCTVDLDGDGEQEVLVRDASGVGGQAVTRDLGDGDADDDVVFAGVRAPSCIQDGFDDGVLGPEWNLAFLGDASIGGAVESGGRLQLSGNGSSLYAGADDTVFLYRDDISGDFRIEVDVEDFPGSVGGAYYKAGLMVRSGLGDQDPRLMVQFVPDFGGAGRSVVQFRYRQCSGCAGDGAWASNRFDVALPARLAIERQGDLYIAELSTDGGATWIRPRGGSQGAVEIPMGDPLIGLNVVSYDAGLVTQAELDDVLVCVP